jgi:acetyltransferase-like isoleucine patch superfamily enzyme
VRYKSRVKFGQNNRIGSNVFLSGLGIQGIKFGNNVSIGDYSRLEVCQSMGNIGLGIDLGDNVGVSAFAGIGGAGGVKIGADCIIGQYFSCHPENHSFEINDRPFRKQEVTREGIRIGSNCWIGAKVTVLDGAVVGNNCVIAANSVVRGIYPNNVLIGGVPSKILRYLE